MRPQVTFRGMFPTQTLIDAVWRRARELGASLPWVEAYGALHVIIEVSERLRAASSRRQYRIAVVLGGELDEAGAQRADSAGDNAHIALDDAFGELRRNAFLRHHSQARRGAA